MFKQETEDEAGEKGVEAVEATAVYRAEGEGPEAGEGTLEGLRVEGEIPAGIDGEVITELT